MSGKRHPVSAFILAAMMMVAASTALLAATPTEPPIDEGMPQVRLPRAKEVTLENGLRVLVLEGVAQIPTFTARMVFTHGGGLYEPADRRGVAAFTAEMLSQGTATRSSAQIAKEFETLGATVEAKAPLSSAFASVTATGLSTHFASVLRMFADVVRNPAFSEAEVARYASRKIADLEVQRARPEFLSQELLLGALYRNHPAALAAPSIEAIKATRSSDLRQFYSRYYSPDAAVLVVVGDVTLEGILPSVRRAFGDWKASRATHPALPPTPVPAPRAVHLLDRPGSVQTVLQLGAIGITRTDPDYFALLVMNDILGGKMSSRLFQNLREKNGYTYGAYSGFTATAIPGVWQISTPVRTEVTAGALEELFAEMQRLRQEPVAATELAGAKRGLIGQYIFSLERPDALLDNVVTRVLYGLPPDYWDTYVDRVQSVSIEDVKRVAGRIVDLDHLQIAAVGDASRIREILDKYATQARSGARAVEPASPGPQGRATFSEDERAMLRRTIAAIADQLVSTAETKPSGIGWSSTDEQGQPRETFNFYDGTPGISYFLLKAAQALGEDKYRRAAESSMAYLLSQVRGDDHGRFFDPTVNGVFVGNAGLAYLFLYAYHALGNEDYLKAAAAIARRMVAMPDVSPTSSPDVISGAAGAGLLLLKMHEVTGEVAYLEGARTLGDFLLNRAETRGEGATWKLTTANQEYYFVGFSHGVAGIGYYMDRLYRATLDERYRIATDQAMRHIETIALREKTNDSVKWYHEQLRRSDRYPSQWCHGAPGMNPFFLERYERQQADREPLRWAIANTRYLIDQGVDVRRNASVCHGISGNAASLYQMYRLTSDRDYLAALKQGLELLYERLGARSADFMARNNDQERDPSYMTGLAGVGDFLILLYTQGRLNMFGPLGYGDDL